MATFSREFLSNLGQPAMTQSLFNLGTALGSVPSAMKAKRKREEIAGIDLKTSEGLTKLAMYYQSRGDLAKAAEVATAAQQLKLSEDQQSSFKTRKAKALTLLESMGLNDLVPIVREITNPEELSEVMKEARLERYSKLQELTTAQKKAIAERRNIRPEEFNILGLKDANNETFFKILEGEEGNAKAWINKSGEIAVYNESNGLIYDPEGKKWVDPSELNLVNEAPQLTKELGDFDGLLTKEVTDEIAPEFIKFKEKAEKAGSLLLLIKRQQGRIEGMDTGLGANAKLQIRRLGELILGREFDPKVTNQEAFIAEAGKLVAEQIKDFGSGTGLSDADREYAKLIAGADPTLQLQTLRNLLSIRERDLTGVVNKWNDTVDRFYEGGDKDRDSLKPLIRRVDVIEQLSTTEAEEAFFNAGG
tara:strand:+ start:594 stop:1850 length:1257 start_codon:yes stop_codon:yes gene_type:complete